MQFPGAILASAAATANAVVDTIDRQSQSLLDHRFEIGDFSISVSSLLAAIIALFVVWLLSRLMQRGFSRYAQSHQEELRPAIYTVSRLTKYAMVVIGIFIALGLLGIPLTQFTLLAGAVGVGLGFGLQAIFSNFISGLILLFDRSLKVGDFVELESGARGEVRDISIRATRIITNDNIDILVPNSEFVTGRVVNWTLHDGFSRLRVPFGVDYGVDKERVKAAALEAAAEVPFTLELEGKRKPQVWLVAFAESSLNFELVVWLDANATRRPSSVKAAYTWALDDALRRHGIGIPFPTTDLNINSLFGLEGVEALRALQGQWPEGDAGKVDDKVEKPAAEKRMPSTGNDALEDTQRQIAEEHDSVSIAIEKSGDKKLPDEQPSDGKSSNNQRR